MALKKYFALSIIAASVAMSACSSDDDDDNGMSDGTVDAGSVDAGAVDAGGVDAGGVDAGGTDAGGVDAGGTDAGGDPDPAPVEDMTTTTGTSILDIARGTDGNDDDDEIDADDSDGGTGPNADLTALVGALQGYPAILNLLDDETQTLTVFAPNNDAFGALTETPDEATLERILSYHVLNGTNLDATAVSGLTVDQPMTFTTAAGAELTVTLDGAGTVSITDGMGNVVPVIATVDSASNGTVHVIGSILMPPADAGMGGDEGGDDSAAGGDTGDDSGAGGAAEGTALAAIEGDGELSTFESVLAQTGFVNNLSDEEGGSDNYITFAPTNTALEGVTVDDPTEIVLRHIYVAPNDGDTLSPGQNVRTTGATAVDVTVGGTADALTVNGFPATLVTSGGSGGAVYKIEGVLQ